MPASQNGYSANDRSVLQTYNVGKTKFLLRKGAPGWLLWHFLTWFDENIRDINPGILDDWSYAERPIRGATALSNHASGTAADVDATKWPLGVAPEVYLTAAEIARVRAQLKLYEGAIRWGGDYTGRKDPMHFEINRDAAFCVRIQAKLQKIQPTVQEDDMYDATARKELIGRLDEVVGMLRGIHPAVAALHIGVLDPTAGVRTLILKLSGQKPVTAAVTPEFLEGLRPLLREAVEEGLANDQGANVDALLDKLADRLAKPA